MPAEGAMGALKNSMSYQTGSVYPLSQTSKIPKFPRKRGCVDLMTNDIKSCSGQTPSGSPLPYV